MSADQRASIRHLGAAFASGGDQYERLRPSYPDAAVDWLIGETPAGARIADVGAGTGKLTASLAERNVEVVAVDPSDDMLAQLRQRLPAIRTQLGTGEATGLPDDYVDLVCFAQSWHWVEPEAGAAEIVRICRPGGSAAWVWSFMDTHVEWVAELSAIWHTLTGAEATDASRHTPQLTSAFGPIESITVDWTETMTPADLVALATTRSYYLTASPQDQQRVRTDSSRLLAERFASAETVELPYRTHCFRARLADASKTTDR